MIHVSPYAPTRAAACDGADPAFQVSPGRFQAIFPVFLVLGLAYVFSGPGQPLFNVAVLAPAEARGAFPGYAYQVGNLLASGNAVWQAQLAQARHDNYGLALAVVAGSAAVIIAAITLFGPERRGTAFKAVA